MTLAPHPSLTLDELVRQFRETAQLLGTAIKLPPNFDKLKRTPKRRACVEKIRALGAELASRNAIPAIRAMFEDEDIDIRGCAAGRGKCSRWPIAPGRLLRNGRRCRKCRSMSWPSGLKMRRRANLRPDLSLWSPPI